jgi:uncharacterized protein involved in exopolysaccharide biosynthesis
MDQNSNAYGDEITLKELILKIQEYWKELWRNWLWIGIIALPFLGYKIYQVFSTPATYPAALTFMVDEDEGRNLSSISGLLGQFGFRSATTSTYNLDKILEISKSRRVIQMALFSRGEVRGKSDFIANHIIDYSDLPRRWRDDTTGLKDFRFSHSDVDRFTMRENRVFKSLMSVVLGSEKKEGMYKTSYDEDTGIMTLRFDARHQDLSIVFLDTIFIKLRDYYIEKSIEKAQNTYQIVKHKADSLAQELADAEYRLASFIDQSQNIFSAREGELQRSRLATLVNRLQITYGEAAKNLQLTELSLLNKEPFITLIDNPLPPLKVSSLPLFRSGMIGLILGTMVGVTLILARKIYRDTMNS